MPAGLRQPAVSHALDAFVAGVDRDHSLPPAERPAAVCRRFRQALGAPIFHVDCMRALLDQIASRPGRQFLCDDPRGRFALQIFCWPPGFGNDPHLHNNWTVAGMMRGALSVYLSTRSAADCQAAVPIAASAGEVGALVPPQYHCLRNESWRTAISLHLFSRDGADADAQDERAAHAERYDDDDIAALAQHAVEQGGDDALECVRTAFALTGPVAGLALMKLMLARAPDEGIAMGRQLARTVGGEDGRRLIVQLDAIAAAPPVVA